jgi:adenylate cyclase
MEAQTIKPYSFSRRLAQSIILGGNAAGALLTMVYFSYIDPIPSGSQVLTSFQGSQAALYFVAILALLGLGSFLSTVTDRGIGASYERLRGGMAASDVHLSVQRRVLNYPAAAALTSAGMWLVAGLLFGYFPRGDVSMFFHVAGVGGVLTVAIVYFGLDAIWREVVSVFFPDGRLSAVQSFGLPVFRRLLIVSVLIGLYPVAMLSTVTLSRAEGLLEAPDPHVVLENMKLAVAFVGGISVFFGISLTILVTRSIVHPLMELRNSMARVAQNDLGVQAKVVSNDELGYVAERFNEMVAGLRQAEMMRNLLNLYVSPEVARDAMENGTHLGGQLVDCSILFSDIRGFTTLSEQLPPQDLIELLNRYMSCMVEVVIANGGLVNKFGGDSLLAVFGTPLNPAEDHAACAIRTALHMQKKLQDFNAGQKQLDGPILQIGIGIASGPAVAGNVGGEGRIEYTVIGDTVNLASRLQDLTKEFARDILVNASAIEQASRSLSLSAEPLQYVSVRGRAEPIELFALTS